MFNPIPDAGRVVISSGSVKTVDDTESFVQERMGCFRQKGKCEKLRIIYRIRFALSCMQKEPLPKIGNDNEYEEFLLKAFKHDKELIGRIIGGAYEEKATGVFYLRHVITMSINKAINVDKKKPSDPLIIDARKILSVVEGSQKEYRELQMDMNGFMSYRLNDDDIYKYLNSIHTKEELDSKYYKSEIESDLEMNTVMWQELPSSFLNKRKRDAEARAKNYQEDEYIFNYMRINKSNEHINRTLQVMEECFKGLGFSFPSTALTSLSDTQSVKELDEAGRKKFIMVIKSLRSGIKHTMKCLDNWRSDFQDDFDQYGEKSCHQMSSDDVYMYLCVGTELFSFEGSIGKDLNEAHLYEKLNEIGRILTKAKKWLSGSVHSEPAFCKELVEAVGDNPLNLPCGGFFLVIPALRFRLDSDFKFLDRLHVVADEYNREVCQTFEICSTEKKSNGSQGEPAPKRIKLE